MRKLFAVLLCLSMLLSFASAEGIIARTMEEEDFSNAFLISRETYPEIYLTTKYPPAHFNNTKDDLQFLCFDYPEGGMPTKFTHEEVTVIDNAQKILYSYDLESNASFEVFLNRADSDEDILRDGEDGIGAYIEVSPNSRNGYGYGMIKMAEFGKSAKLIITVRMYRMNDELPLEERRQTVAAAIENEIERVRSGMQLRTIRPYWSAGRFDGIKLEDYDSKVLAAFDFFPLEGRIRESGEPVQGNLVVTAIKNSGMEGIYDFGGGLYVNLEMKINTYGNFFTRYEKNEDDTGLMETDNGGVWAYWLTNMYDDGSVYAWHAERRLDGYTDDGSQLYLEFYLSNGSGILWDNPETCFRIVDELESHLRFCRPEDDPYVEPDEPAEPAEEAEAEPEDEPAEEEPAEAGEPAEEEPTPVAIPAEEEPAAAGEPAEEEPAAATEADDTWICPACGTENRGKFCSECGGAKPAPESSDWTCPNCGTVNEGKFCTECGSSRP